MYGGIKRTALDAAFSDLVRERNDWTCERCGLVDNDGRASGKSRRVENSHFYSRRHQSTRFHGDNCDCLCKGCHKYFTEDNTGQYAVWKRRNLGDTRYELLQDRHNWIAKRSKQEKKEMTEHFRAQYKHIRRRRRIGEQGYIDFVEWD